jgi:hypothetical protein
MESFKVGLPSLNLLLTEQQIFFSLPTKNTYFLKLLAHGFYNSGMGVKFNFGI